MNKLWDKLRTSKYSLSLVFIISVAAVLRLANFSQRWVLNPDQAWAGIVAIKGIRENIWPLIGFPSSAGPFNFGPLFFWLTTILAKLFPFASGPWFGFIIVSILTVIAFYKLGEVAYGKTFGLVLSLLAAVSTPLIIEASNLMNTILVAYAAVFVLLFAALLINRGKNAYGYLLGLSLGVAINAHFQAVGLLVILPLAMLLSNFNLKKKVLLSAVTGLGLLTAFLPLIIFDLSNNGIWHQSLIDYSLHGQNKFYIPIRWLTEIRDFWPQMFGVVLAKVPQLGYFILVFLFGAIFLTWKKKLPYPRVWLVFALTLILQVVILRYYKGPRSPEYLFFVYPLIIFFIAWTVYIWLRVYKPVGIVLVLLLLLVTTYQNIQAINSPGQAQIILNLEQKLGDVKKVDFYTIPPARNMVSLPLFYLLDQEGRISSDGKKIGACEMDGKVDCPKDNALTDSGRYRIYNLNNLSVDQIRNLGFENLTRDIVYNWIYTNYKR